MMFMGPFLVSDTSEAKKFQLDVYDQFTPMA